MLWFGNANPGNGIKMFLAKKSSTKLFFASRKIATNEKIKARSVIYISHRKNKLHEKNYF